MSSARTLGFVALIFALLASETAEAQQPSYGDLVPVLGHSEAYWEGFCEDLDAAGNTLSKPRPSWGLLSKPNHWEPDTDGPPSSRYPDYQKISNNLKLVQSLQFILSVLTNLTNRIEDAQKQVDQLDFDGIAAFGTVPQAPGHCVCMAKGGCAPDKVLDEVDHLLDELLDAQKLESVLDRFLSDQVEATASDLQDLELYFEELLAPGGGLETDLTGAFYDAVDAELEVLIEQLKPGAGKACELDDIQTYPQELRDAVEATATDVRIKIEADVQALETAIQTAITLPSATVHKIKEDLAELQALFSGVKTKEDLLQLDFAEVQSKLNSMTSYYEAEVEKVQGQIDTLNQIWDDADFYSNLSETLRKKVQEKLEQTKVGPCLAVLDDPGNFTLPSGQNLIKLGERMRARFSAVLQQQIGAAHQQVETVLVRLEERIEGAPQAILANLKTAAASIPTSLSGCYLRGTRPECFDFCGTASDEFLWLPVDFLQDPKAQVATALEAGKFALKQAGWLDEVRAWVDDDDEDGFRAKVSGGLGKALGEIEGIKEAIGTILAVLGKGLEYTDRFMEGSHLGAYTVLRPDLHMCVPYAGHGAYAQLGNLGGDRFSIGARYTSHNLSKRHRVGFRSGGFAVSAFGRELSLLPGIELTTQLDGFRLWNPNRPLGIPLSGTIDLGTVEKLDVFNVVPKGQFNQSSANDPQYPGGKMPVGSAIVRDLFPSKPSSLATADWPRPGIDQPWENESTAVVSLGLNLKFDLPKQDWKLPTIIIIPPSVLTATPRFGFAAGTEWVHQSNLFRDRIEKMVNVNLPSEIQLDAQDFEREMHAFQAPDLSTDDRNSIYVEPSVGLDAFLGFRVWKVSIGAGASADLAVNLRPGGQGGVLDLNSALSDAIEASNPPREAECKAKWHLEKAEHCGNRAFPESTGSYACEPLQGGGSCCITASWPGGAERFCIDEWTGMDGGQCNGLNQNVDAKSIRGALDSVPGFLSKAAERLIGLAETHDGLGLTTAWNAEAACASSPCGKPAPRISTAGLNITALSECQSHGFCTDPDGGITHDTTLGRCEGPTRYQQVALGDSRSRRGCALRTGGALDCWGERFPSPTGIFQQVSTSRFGACGLRPDGRIECWDSPRGGANPPAGKFLSVAAGDDFSCGIRTNRTLECWGQGSGTKPPSGKFLQVDIVHQAACAVASDQRVHCWGGIEEPGNLKGVGPAKAVKMTNWPGVAVLLEDGQIELRGLTEQAVTSCDLKALNMVGQRPYTEIAVRGHCGLCGLRDDGSVNCRQLSSSDLEVPPPGAKFASIASFGHSNTLCGIDAEGLVTCWNGPGPPEVERGRFTPYGCRTEITPSLEGWEGDGCHPLQHGFQSACACASDAQCASTEQCDSASGLCATGAGAASCLAAEDGSCPPGRLSLEGACTRSCTADSECAGSAVCEGGLCRPPHGIPFAEQIVWGMKHVPIPRHTINTYALSDFEATLILSASAYVEASFKLFGKPKTWSLLDFSDAWDLGSTYKGWYQPGLAARYDDECGTPSLPWEVTNHFPTSPTAGGSLHSATNAQGISDPKRHCGPLQGGGVCRYPSPPATNAGDVGDLVRWCREDLPQHAEDPQASSNDDVVDSIASTIEWGQDVGLDLWAENQVCIGGQTWDQWLKGLAPTYDDNGKVIDRGSLDETQCVYDDPKMGASFTFPCSELAERMLAIWDCTGLGAPWAQQVAARPGVTSSWDAIAQREVLDLDSIFRPAPEPKPFVNDGGFPFTRDNLRPELRTVAGYRWLERVSFCFDRRFEDPAEAACECASVADCKSEQGERCEEGRCERPRIYDERGECLLPGCRPVWQARECPIVRLQVAAGPCCGDGVVQQTETYHEECDPLAREAAQCDQRCSRTVPSSGCENDLLVNGSFEEPAIRDRSFSQPQQLRGWRLSEGRLFELQRNIMGPAEDGQQYLELASNAPTTIYQPVQLQPGIPYVLHVAYSARPGYADNTVEIRLDGQTIGTLSASGKGKRQTSWKEHTFVVRGNGRPGRLEIIDRSQPDAGGGFIDNVRLCEPPPPPRCEENMVSNGSFEEPRIRGRFSHLRQIPGWSRVEGPTLELQRNIFGPAADGQQYMEMASSAPVVVAQTVATRPRAEYLLQVAYSARPGYRDNAVELKFDGRTVAMLRADGGGARTADWQEHRFVVRSSGAQSVIELLDRSAADGGGGFIDDVRLCPAPRSRSR